MYNKDKTERKLIIDVWTENLEEEFARIRELVLTHPYIAMDTEFPGVVWRVKTENPLQYQYLNLCANVNMLKIIQLGLTFSDAKGNLPPTGPSTWQFNFRFALHEDAYAMDSIELLRESGIDFAAFERRGIDPQHFAELMLTSGICLNDRITWLSFHSGFDFGYLIRMLTGRVLPESEDEFHTLLATLFGRVLDTKYLLKQTTGLSHTVGLTVLADDLNVLRIGPAHQAGSDSLLTWATFFKLVHDHFDSNLDEKVYANILFGLGRDASAVPAAVLNAVTTGAVPHARNIGLPTPSVGSPALQPLPPPLPVTFDIETAQVQQMLHATNAPRGIVISDMPTLPPPMAPMAPFVPAKGPNRVAGATRARGTHVLCDV